MNTTLAIMFSVNILNAIAFICEYRLSNRIRKAWHKSAARVIEQQGEIQAWKEAKEEWQDIAHQSVIDNNRMKNQLDALINGDVVCPNGHRFYDGDGYKCPHCAAITKFSQPAEA